MLVLKKSANQIPRGIMPSKDGKIFDTIVYIGLSVNVVVAIYLFLMYFEVI